MRRPPPPPPNNRGEVSAFGDSENTATVEKLTDDLVKTTVKNGEKGFKGAIKNGLKTALKSGVTKGLIIGVKYGVAALNVLSIGLSVKAIHDAPPDQKLKTTVREAGKFAGGSAGGYIGGAVVAVIATAAGVSNPVSWLLILGGWLPVAQPDHISVANWETKRTRPRRPT